jgi:hypothetical protein
MVEPYLPFPIYMYIHGMLRNLLSAGTTLPLSCITQVYEIMPVTVRRTTKMSITRCGYCIPVLMRITVKLSFRFYYIEACYFVLNYP